MRNTVSDRLKSLIRESGLNIKEFSKRSGIPYRTLQDYLAGKIVPGGDNLIKMATEFRISLDWLLLGKEQAEIPGVAEEQAAFNSDFLREVIIGVEEFLREEDKDLEPRDKAELITTLFTEAQKMEAEGVEASSRAFRLSKLIARFVGSH